LGFWAYFEIRAMLSNLNESLMKITDLIEATKQRDEDPNEMSFDEKLDRLKIEVRAYLRADDPEEWERKNQWHWSDWEVEGWSVA